VISAEPPHKSLRGCALLEFVERGRDFLPVFVAVLLASSLWMVWRSTPIGRGGGRTGKGNGVTGH
jgi:hypothetical protein